MTNQISVVGNMTREPELRFTQNGSGICNFGVASSRRFKRGDEWEEQTTFFNVTAWGELGEHIAESLPKGTRVIVVGRMDQRSYETQDGEKRTVMDLTADSVGAELRFATVEVNRIKRESGGRSSGERDQYVPPAEEPF